MIGCMYRIDWKWWTSNDCIEYLGTQKRCYMIKLYDRYDVIWWYHMIDFNIRDWGYGYVVT